MLHLVGGEELVEVCAGLVLCEFNGSLEERLEVLCEVVAFQQFQALLVVLLIDHLLDYKLQRSPDAAPPHKCLNHLHLKLPTQPNPALLIRKPLKTPHRNIKIGPLLPITPTILLVTHSLCSPQQF